MWFVNELRVFVVYVRRSKFPLSFRLIEPMELIFVELKIFAFSLI
jgi:hypothetical protein